MLMKKSRREDQEGWGLNCGFKQVVRKGLAEMVLFEQRLGVSPVDLISWGRASQKTGWPVHRPWGRNWQGRWCRMDGGRDR